MTPRIDDFVRVFRTFRGKDQSLLKEMMRSGVSSYAEVADFAAANLSSQAQMWLEEVLQQGDLEHVKSILRMPVSTAPSREVIKAGHKLICPVCSYDCFWSHKTLMNTRGDLNSMNRNAVNYICERCGYIFWFFE
ncbi:MAG TPA: hypothetical protein V6C57_02400 [Coleofasciculaceae cyanobacterium]